MKGNGYLEANLKKSLIQEFFNGKKFNKKALVAILLLLLSIPCNCLVHKLKLNTNYVYILTAIRAYRAYTDSIESLVLIRPTVVMLQPV
jgi:hypothetical protein